MAIEERRFEERRKEDEEEKRFNTPSVFSFR
jgi:hypothetical protein